MARGSAIGQRRDAAKDDAGEGYQARRREIADAAVRVFNRLGYNGASISAVAAELQTDRASLYYYVSSKEELFDDVVRAVIERNADMASAIQRSDQPSRCKLHDLIVGLMVSYADSYPLIYIYIRENLSHVSDKRSEWSRGMRALNRAIEDAIVAIIDRGVADGSFRNVGSSRIIAFGILGMLGWTNRWYRPETSELSAREIGTTYADLVLGGLDSPY
jgi:TetR/AcrR family transcriptional regulator, cholesterol catabolism regulator